MALFFNKRRPCLYIKRIVLSLCVLVIVICLGFNRSYRHLPLEELLSPSNVFKENISKDERDLYRTLLLVFDRLAKQVNVTYFLADGSLIGSVRHHGMIPWDDDLDIGVLLSERHKMHQMTNMLPGNVLLFENWFRWKMCFKGRPRVLFGRGWTFPTLDIGFYEMGGGQIWDENWKSFKAAQMDLDVVFPLIKRPFMGLMVPAPHRPQRYIDMNFRTDHMTLCASPTFSHRSAFYSDPYVRRTVRCEALWSLYPFVHRTRLIDLNGSYLVNETLMLKETVLSSLLTRY